MSDHPLSINIQSFRSIHIYPMYHQVSVVTSQVVPLYILLLILSFSLFEFCSLQGISLKDLNISEVDTRYLFTWFLKTEFDMMVDR